MAKSRISQQSIGKACEDAEPKFQLVSATTLAEELDASTTSVHRWLQAAGIKPVVVGRGRNGSIRYVRSDVQRWLESLERLG